MKPFRLLFIGVGSVLVLAVLALAVAYNSSFQTWAVRKAIASQLGLRVTVGSVSAGTNNVRVTDLRWVRDGMTLVVPTAELAMPLWSAAVSKRVSISRLVAQGWTLDMARAPTSPSAASVTSGSLTSPAGSAAQAFAGVFGQLQLPIDLTVDGVDLAGDVVLADARGRVALMVKGGGLGAGRDGKFDLAATAALSDPQVSRLEVHGGVVAAMDTPRTFTRLATRLEASASGAKFNQPVKLTADLAAARSAAGETYSALVVAGGQEIIAVTADFPSGAERLAGTWNVDVREADVAPFVLGKPLPDFTAIGAGKFDTDAAFTAVHATGQLNAIASRLEVIMPELAALGELKIAAEFDLAERAGTLSVQKFQTAITAEQPILSIRSLQPFDFNPTTRELRPADSAQELLGVVVQGVPVAWAKPFIKDFEVTGGFLRGELVATPRAGGLTLRTITPLTLGDISVTQLGKLLVQQLNFQSHLSADYTPKGWQAEIIGMTATSADKTLLRVDAKAGQLAGKGEPMKATGKIAGNLVAVLTQPAALGTLLLTSGDVAAEFAASLEGKSELQAKIELTNLASMVDKQAVKLPTVTADIRVDFATDAKVVFNAPLVIERDQRRSDLTIAGFISPEKDKVRSVEANLTSAQLVVDDARIFAAVLPVKPKAASQATIGEKPPWAGLSGLVTLQLKKVIYSDEFEVTNLGGRLRIDAGTLKLEGMQAGLGEGGRANVRGSVTFDSTMAQPYGMTAEVAVHEFDPGPLFRGLNASQPATVEGRFDVESKLNGRATTLSDLALGAGGSFQLTSRGGVFRGLPVDVSSAVETTGKVAGWIASAGTALSAMAGKKEYTDTVSKVQAVSELAKGLNPIPYDQLSVVISRDAALNTTLRNFTLISPEVRLTGGGTALHKAGASILDDSLAMEFTLRARGRQSELLKLLGALEGAADDFGYATSTLPLKVTGTLGRPDTSELNARLVALALEKTGVTDKAADLFNKLRGGSR